MSGRECLGKAGTAHSGPALHPPAPFSTTHSPHCFRRRHAHRVPAARASFACAPAGSGLPHSGVAGELRHLPPEGVTGNTSCPRRGPTRPLRPARQQESRASERGCPNALRHLAARSDSSRRVRTRSLILQAACRRRGFRARLLRGRSCKRPTPAERRGSPLRRAWIECQPTGAVGPHLDKAAWVIRPGVVACQLHDRGTQI